MFLVLRMPEEDIGSSVSRATDGCVLLFGYQEPNLVNEKQEFFDAVPSL